MGITYSTLFWEGASLILGRRSRLSNSISQTQRREPSELLTAEVSEMTPSLPSEPVTAPGTSKTAMDKENKAPSTSTKRARVSSLQQPCRKKLRFDSEVIRSPTPDPGIVAKDDVKRVQREEVETTVTTRLMKTIANNTEHRNNRKISVEPNLQPNSRVEPDSSEDMERPSDLLDEKVEWSSKDLVERRRVGEGGFSKVFSAVVKGDRRVKVALKYTTNKTLAYLNRNNECTCAFTDEYRLHRSLLHENVVRAYGFYKMTRNAVMVMEFCSGGDLQEYLAGERAPITKTR
jgi:hypothetical protein